MSWIRNPLLSILIRLPGSVVWILFLRCLESVMTLSTIPTARHLREVRLYYRTGEGQRLSRLTLIQAVYQSSKHSYNNIGITLLEVLIATLIISVIVFPLFISFTSASRSNSDAERTGASTYFAQGKLEEVLAMDFADIGVSSP